MWVGDRSEQVGIFGCVGLCEAKVQPKWPSGVPLDDYTVSSAQNSAGVYFMS